MSLTFPVYRESALEAGIAFDEEDESLLTKRPPVVTIMGHVDHGKTSLLDAIRNTKVTAGEAGGITQNIHAYQISQNGEKITFIDTPGHAAFTDMRQRGANITDIVVLVVAADDGVMQQTADSIACARQAGVPLIVAVNKIDLPTANVDKVKSALTAYDVLTEDLGGDVLYAEISAKNKVGLDELLEKVLLQAEIEDLKANPERQAQGAVIEASIEKGLGTVATTLIQKGTLKVGDIFVCGSTSGRVKALLATDGKTRLKEAGPSSPVQVVGFDGVPMAGDLLAVCDSEQIARDLAASRSRLSREREAAAYQSGLMESVAATFAADGKFKERREMCVVVKADVQGSAEALTRALRDLKLENDEVIVTIKVLVSEAGEVSKSDVAVASVTPGTTIIAFNTGANFAAMEDARSLKIPIEYFNIVYDAIESVESRMQEVLSPTPEGEYAGQVIVQEVFNIGGVGNIAGSRCTDGYIKKGSNARILRGDKILCESKIKSLRNFKSEVDKIESGDECGVGLLDFEDFQPGDVIESYVISSK
jgi:translation initiation factor IF-2